LSRHHAALALEHKIRPGLDCAISGGRALTDSLGHDSEPTFLVCSAVGVKVNHFTISKANPETLFDKHVAVFFLCEGRLPATAIFGAGLLLKK
jgi:hypothetical protein